MERFRRHRPDYLITLSMVVLMLLGLVIIYAVSPALAERINATGQGGNLDHNHFMYRQLGYLVIGVIAFLVTAFVPLDFWRKCRTQIFGAAVVLSVLLVLLPGALTISVNGATRWINLGFISFQPAELLKFGLVIFMAAFLSSRIREQKLDSRDETIMPLVIILGLVSLLVVVAQKDMGTMFALLAIFLVSLYMAGVNRRNMAMLIGGIIAAGVLLVVTFPHRMARILTFLNPQGDPNGAGYHINQALIAVGSGGFSGRGLGQSIQAFGYLPEAANDSIFAILAEKFGFIGTIIVLCIFGFLFFRIIRVMERAPTDYMRLLVAGVFGWLVAHTLVNIGAMLSVLPLTGVTLPFLSFGGTSLLFIMAALGLVVNVSRYTVHSSGKEEATNANTRRGRRLGGSRHPSLSNS
ncbi:MAG TPA: putative peptidoglycan glycosyltransferase FtsW [Candidatus Saccharimonadales bacterium]|nr:putative peptidoglycan glycosyltransferase FtsW [Candidatus Saccharimonadales bacterium]